MRHPSRELVSLTRSVPGQPEILAIGQEYLSTHTPWMSVVKLTPAEEAEVNALFEKINARLREES